MVDRGRRAAARHKAPGRIRHAVAMVVGVTVFVVGAAFLIHLYVERSQALSAGTSGSDSAQESPALDPIPVTVAALRRVA